MFRRVFLTLLLVMGISFAATAVTECTTIAAPGYYYMANDVINNTADPCIEITTDDVIFDCNYHYLEAHEGAIYSGTANPHNLTIANCSIFSANDPQISIKGAGQDFHFLNLELNGSTPSLTFWANDSSVYNLSSNSSQAIYLGAVWNIVIEDVTGTGPTPAQIYAEGAVDYSIKDLDQAWTSLNDAWNGTVENVYCSNQDTESCYTLTETIPYSISNNTLRNAYFFDCLGGGLPTPCMRFGKFVGNVYFYDVELIRPSGFYFPIGAYAEGFNVVNASGDSVYVLQDSIIENMNISLNQSLAGTAALFPQGNNLTVTNVIIELNHASQKGIAVWGNLYNSTFEHFEISDGATGIEVGPRFPAEDCTFREITIINMGSHGVYSFADSEIVFDELDISDAKWGIYFGPFANAGLEFHNVEIEDCALGLYSEASGLQFENLTMLDVGSGIYFDTGDNRFSNLDINATDLGIQVEGGYVQYNSFDGMNVQVSNPNGIGINLSMDRFSNYTNGDISGGKYCIWTYLARENNTYSELELHDCDTGFVLSNKVTPTTSTYVNTTGVHIYDVLLAYDMSDFWYEVVFEDMLFGDNSGGMGLEFVTLGCIGLNPTARPAPLPAGYNEFLGNYLEINEFDLARSCSAPAHYGFMNETGFSWSAAQEDGYDMSTLKVLKWSGRQWVEVPGTLDLANRIFEAGYIGNFSIFTMTADLASGGGNGGGSTDKGDIILVFPPEAYVLEPVIIQTLDDHGDPLNAKVSITLEGDTVFYGFVGADGEVEITPLEQGSYTVVATKNNYDSPPAAHFVALLRDLDASVPASVEEGEQFSVTVTSENTPLEGARAEIDGLVKITGMEGTTTFTLSSAGNYFIEITKAGYHTWSGIIDVRAEEEKSEPLEEEEAGIVIIGEVEEVEEETIHPPIVQGEVPSVESPQQPVNGAQIEIQQHWFWMVLLLLIMLAAIIYWLVKNREKK